MFAGGEFYKDARWLKDEPTIDTEGMTFLNGGKACLIVISAYLRTQGIDNILLPAYPVPNHRGHAGTLRFGLRVLWRACGSDD